MKFSILLAALTASTFPLVSNAATEACNQKIMVAGYNAILSTMTANEIAGSTLTLSFMGGPDHSGDYKVSVSVHSFIDGSDTEKTVQIGVESSTCKLTPRNVIQ